jgi:hypothetical protein
VASNIAQARQNPARNPNCASLPRKTPTTLPAIGNDSSTMIGAPLLHPFPATMRT